MMKMIINKIKKTHSNIMIDQQLEPHIPNPGYLLII